MKHLLTLLTLFAVALCARGAERVSLLLDEWQFRRADTCQWQAVRLPHDFQISQPWVEPAASERPDNSDVAANIKSRLSARGFKEMGRGYYRTTLTVPDSLRGRRLLLDFEGLLLVGDVYLNGQRIGGTDYGYLGFDIDITQAYRWGQQNELTVQCSTMNANNSRWYTGAGLVRDVRLVATDARLYFDRHAMRITTTQNRTVHLAATLTYAARGRDTATVATDILDAAGRVVATATTRLPLVSGRPQREFALSDITLADPCLWDCDNPYLYTARVTLIDSRGVATDRVEQTFGVRTVQYTPQQGLLLNGKKVLLRGFAGHHTLGPLGAADYPRAIEKRLLMLKQYGINHVRTSHNPYSVAFLDLCDRLGILVVDELYDKWTPPYSGWRCPWSNQWQRDLPEFVTRDRNHPCVVMWSVGNELQQIWDQPHHDWGVTPYRLMRQLLRRYDDTRPVTVAMHPRYRDPDNDSLPAPLARVTDIAAYNYRYMYFDGDGRRYPDMMFYQAEASVAAMGPNYYEMNRDRVVGLAYWGLIDYLGESQGWPEKGWAQGVFYLNLQPKPKATLLRAMLTEEPVVGIGIVERGGSDKLWNGVKTTNALMSKNWNRPAGSTVSLFTYTNADEVELLLNGRSLGTKKNDTADPKTRCQIRWNDVPYAPGTLVAVARTAGREVARDVLQTTGPAVRLVAEADRRQATADGRDLIHVAVRAVDAKGRTVYAADDKLTFAATGPAEIVGVANGNIASGESLTADSRSLWLGEAQVILRTQKQPGNATLTISSPKYKPVRLRLDIK